MLLAGDAGLESSSCFFFCPQSDLTVLVHEQIPNAQDLVPGMRSTSEPGSPNKQ